MKNILTIGLIIASFTFICHSQNEIDVLSQLELPKPKKQGNYSLEQIVSAEANFDKFSQKPLSLSIISQLLWSGNSVMDPNASNGTLFSGVSTESVKIYVVIKNGVYIFQPEKNVIFKISSNDIRKKISSGVKLVSVVENSPCTLIIATNITDFNKKFGDFSLVSQYLVSGHIAQNMYLQGLTMELAVVPLMIQKPSVVSENLELTAMFNPTYVISTGFAVKDQVVKLEKTLDSNDVDDFAISMGDTHKAVIIIPEGLIADWEFYGTGDVLEAAGFQYDVAAPDIDTYRTDRRGLIEPKIEIRDINIDNYDAIVLVSSQQIRSDYDREPILSLLQNANRQNKIIAAIGRSVRVLAEADIVRDKIVTGSPAALSSLKNAGATFTNGRAERSGNIITAQDFENVPEFGKLIKQAVEGQQSRVGGGGRYIDPRVLEKRGYDTDQMRRSGRY